jgi:hypothetical protein
LMMRTEKERTPKLSWIIMPTRPTIEQVLLSASFY